MFDHLFILTDDRCACGMSFLERINKLILCPCCGFYEFYVPKQEPPKEVMQKPIIQKMIKKQGRPPKYRPAKRKKTEPITEIYLDEKTGKFSTIPPNIQ